MLYCEGICSLCSALIMKKLANCEEFSKSRTVTENVPKNIIRMQFLL